MLSSHQTVSGFCPEQEHKERRLYFYEKGEEIYLEPSGLWQVYRGVVQLSQLQASGEEILLGWALPNNFFGDYFTKISPYQGKALTDVYLKWYLLDEIEKNQILSQTIIKQLINKNKQTEALLAIAGIKRVEERLQKLLELLKEEVSEPISQGNRLIVRFTHQNLANTIGTTRVTITRLLGEFQRQGWISFDSDRHIILDKNAFT